MFNAYKSYLWDLFWFIPSSFLALFLFYMNNLSGLIFILTLVISYGWQLKTIIDIKRNYPDETILFTHHPPIILYAFCLSILICVNTYIFPYLLFYKKYSLFENLYNYTCFLGFLIMIIMFFIFSITIKVLTNKRFISKPLINLKITNQILFSQKNVPINNIVNVDYKLNAKNSYTINIYQKNNINIYFNALLKKTAEQFCDILNNLLEQNMEENI